jgi:hypothetical protein
LPIERSNRGGVNDHTALAGGKRLGLRDRGGREPDHVEGPDEVDGHRFGKRSQRMRPVLPERFLSCPDPRAVDEPAQFPERARRRGHGPGRVGFACDVAVRVMPTDLTRDRFPARVVEIGDDDPRATRA